MSGLPETWKILKLDAILEVLEAGVRPKGGVKDILEGYPSLGAEHLTSQGSFNFRNVRYIPEEFAHNLTKGIISQGDILIVKDGATTGRVAFVDDKFPFDRSFINEHLFKLSIYEGFGNPKFIYWFLFSPVGKQEVLKNLRGAAQGGINKSFAQYVTIPLPPITEQNQIVNLLDRAINKIVSAKLKLDKVLEIKSRLRQTIINNAASGNLTSKWRLSNKMPEWETVLLKDVIFDKPRNGYSPKPVEYKTEIKSLTLTATTSGKFDSSYYKYIDEDIRDESYLWLETGDILIQRGNTIEYVGVSAIYRGSYKTFIYPDLMIKIKPNERILSDFLYYVLSSTETREYFKNNATGVAGSMPKINQKVVSNTSFRLPSLNEQHEIVRRTEALLALNDGLAVRHKEAVEKINSAKDLILSNAFNATLTKNWRDQNQNQVSSLELMNLPIKRKLNSRKPNKEKVEKIMKNSITPIIETLEKFTKPLSSNELLQFSGYPNDASVELIERFFTEIRTQIIDGKIERKRIGYEDFFERINYNK